MSLRMDLLVLFIFSVFYCLQSSESQHAKSDAGKPFKLPANDSAEINFQYYEGDSILLPGDANKSGIVPGDVPTNIHNPPSTDCAEDEAASAEGKIAVDNKDAIVIDGSRPDKKKIQKKLKIKRPCKTANKADYDKLRGNQNDTEQNNVTSNRDLASPEDGTDRKAMICTVAILVSVFLVVAVAVAVVAWYKCRKTDEVPVDIEMGNRAEDSSATALSPADDSSTQLISQEISENAENEVARNAPELERQFSNVSDDMFYDVSGPQSIVSFKSTYATAGPQRQFSTASYMTAFEGSGPQSILSNMSFRSACETFPPTNGSLEHSYENDTCEGDENEQFQYRIDGNAVSEKWEQRVSSPPGEEASNCEEATHSEKPGVFESFKRLFHKK